MRAPTPTAAGELVTEFAYQVKDKLKELNDDLIKTIRLAFKTKRYHLNSLRTNIKSPLVILREQSQKLDSYELRLKQKIELNYSKNSQALKIIISRLMERSPKSLFQELKSRIINIRKILDKDIQNKVFINRNKLKEFNKNLTILNPLSILDRGYSIIQNKDGHAIKSNTDVLVGEELSARLSNGFIDIEVKSNDSK